MIAWLRGAASAWNRFWFESAAPAQMKVFRVALGLMLFAFYLIRTLDLDLFYSNQGMLPVDVMLDVMPMRYRPSLLTYFSGQIALWACHLSFLASLGTLALGFFPRLSALVAFVLHVSFMHRNMSTVFGIDLIATFFLFYLCFASYDPRGKAGPLREAMASMARRLIQVQVCVIYGYSGLEKMKGVRWWRGEAIWDVLSNGQLARFDMGWLSDFPLVLVAFAYLTLAWEIYFPALIWQRRLRNAFLLFGVGLHVGIGLFMSIPFFGLIMIVSYLTFIDARVLVRARRLIRRRKRTQAGAAWAGAAPIRLPATANLSAGGAGDGDLR